MAQVSDVHKLAVAYFAALDKQLTEANQYPFESKYRALPNISSDVLWAQPVDYAVDATAADLNVSNSPTVLNKYTLQSLTAIPGTNNQAWYINDGAFIRNWISPTDIPHITTNEPSYGYQAQLYTSTNTLITPTQGRWNVFYAQGIVLFEEGSTPVDLGYGTPKITCYNYIGSKGFPDVPTVTKYTIPHTSLQTAALTNDVGVLSLPAGSQVESIVLKHTAAFTGTGITGYRISIGIAGNANKYTSDLNVFQAPSNTLFLLSNSPNIENFGASTSIRIFATAVGANLDQTTTGSVDIYVKQNTMI